jgi:MFS family permease
LTLSPNTTPGPSSVSRHALKPEEIIFMRKAMLLVLMLGLVSLCGDVVYEGARAVTGPFLYSLGATAAAVGLVSGIGEFAGYGLRLVAGRLADRTSHYWALVFIGYGMIVAVPLLAFAGRWEIAAVLVILERTGKAMRTPAREVIISSAGKAIGTGWAFGVHEALDQVGAFAGPLIFTAALTLDRAKGEMTGYRTGFLILFIPFVVMLGILALTRRRFPEPHRFEKSDGGAGGGMPRAFWLYLVFACLTICGFANFQIISFHFKARAITSDALIPVLYAGAMGSDAVAALAVGKLYDRRGMGVLLLLPFVSMAALPLVFAAHMGGAVTGILLWGIAVGIHETMMRAAIADMVPLVRRGWAYGVFYMAFGLAWFAGSLAIGALYGVSIRYAIAFGIVFQVAAIPAFIAFKRARI